MSEKLSERLVRELKTVNEEHGGFTGWPDSMEEIIDAVEALEKERDWLKANLKSAGQVIGLALTTSQGTLEDRLSAALRREDTLRQLNDELNEEVLRLHRVLEAKEYGTP